MLTITIAKANTQLEVDFEALPEASRAYIINYGLTQCLNDAAASIPKDDAKVGELTMAKVGKKMDALVSGTVRVAGVRVGDPIKARAIELAIDWTVRDAFKKARKPLDAKAMREEAIRLVERNGAYLHRAQALIDVEAREAKEFAAQITEDDLAGLQPAE